MYSPKIPSNLVRPFTLSLAAVATFFVTSSIAAPSSYPGNYGQGRNRPVDFVDPLIGTGKAAGVTYGTACGNVFPGATAPFGMVQLSPDLDDYDTTESTGGYNYADTMIHGFSHTHLSGTGIKGLGDVTVMPMTGSIVWDQNRYTTPFTHQNELAKPGYYRVLLNQSNILVELTATERVGVHRYTFPAKALPNILFDLTHNNSGRVNDGELTLYPGNKKISGYTEASNSWWGVTSRYYFVAEFSTPYRTAQLNKNGTIQSGSVTQINGGPVAGGFTFAPNNSNTTQIQVNVALSTVSVANAEMNLKKEVSGSKFDTVCGKTVNQWNDALTRVTVETPDTSRKTAFYTALYHSLLTPSIYSDVNGAYTGADKLAHQDPSTYYSTYSNWDIYRAQWPLLILVQPERINDMVTTLLKMSEQSANHCLPKWTLVSQDTGVMQGYHAVSMISEAFVAGFHGFDTTEAWNAMLTTANSTTLFPNIDTYTKLGYLPAKMPVSDSMGHPVANTLEYAYDDWCIAQYGKALGRPATETNPYDLRSQYFRNLFNPVNGFFMPKLANGSWAVDLKQFDSTQANNTFFTEGSAWQYLWSVEQDIPSLIQLLGGNDSFSAKLDECLAGKAFDDGFVAASQHIGYYSQGNEPDHQALYLYDCAKHPWLTQKWVRFACDKYFTNQPDGIPGNDDCGQMSAWFVFGSIGFYPVNPVDGRYWIGSPVYPKVQIRISKDHAPSRWFTVITHNGSDKNIYIQSATLNSKPLNRPYITLDEIMSGGRLEFTMSDTPNQNWGSE